VVAATIAALWGWLRPAPAQPLNQFALALRPTEALQPPPNTGGARVAISPDGRMMVYLGPGEGGARLWLRRLDQLSATPIGGSEGASSPFFSPDGRRVGFIKEGTSVRLASLGGAPTVTLTDKANSTSGDWGDDGYVYFEVDSGLARMRPTGGPIEPVAEALADLHAPHGVFAVLGNHDDERDVPRALARRGIALLNDARTRVAIGDTALELAGIRFWTTRRDVVAHAVRGAEGPVVLLAHDPRRLPEAAAAGVSLVLSGHTHGGQIVLPGLGAVAARRFPTVAGLAQHDRTTLFVSRGVGTVYVPVRINCPPEVHVITLTNRQSPAAV